MFSSRYTGFRLFLHTAVLFFLALAGIPLAALVLPALRGGSLPDALPDGGLLVRSVYVSGLAALLAGVTGTTMAFILERTGFRGRFAVALLLLVPLMVPPYVVAVGLSYLTLPSGPLEFLGTGLLNRLDHLLFGQIGLIITHTAVFTPIPMTMTAAALRAVPPDLEEAARTMAPWHTVMLKVTGPLVAPAAGAGTVAVFLLSLGEVTVPSYFHVNVLGTHILTRLAAFYDFEGAAAGALTTALAFAAILAALAPVWSEAWRALRPSPQRRPRTAHPTVPHGPVRLAAAGLMLFIPFMVAVIPLWGLISVMDSPSDLVSAAVHSADALARSVFMGAGTAMLMTFLGFILGYAVGRGVFTGRRAFLMFALLVLALPPAVMALGFTASWNSGPLEPLYRSGAVVVGALVARFLPVPVFMVMHHLESMPRSMEEAAAVMGAGPVTRLLRIVLPMSAVSLAGVWLVSWVLVVRDTATVMVLYPPGQDTLPVRIFTEMANGSPSTVSSMCLLMILLVLIPPLLVAAATAPLRHKAIGCVQKDQ